MRFLVHIIALAAVTAAASGALAGDGPFVKSHCGGGHFVHCPKCHHACEFSIEPEKVTKDCYEVECKTICIPCVVFPWQKSHCDHGKGGKHGKGGCFAHNGAKSKCVRVLKKYEYECERCKCKWTPVGGKKSGCGSVKAYEIEGGEIEVDLDDNPVPEPPAVDARVRRTPIVQPAALIR
jgi:hypothetical protein